MTDEEDSVKSRVLENIVILGFHINTLGNLMDDPKYYADRKVFEFLILQHSHVIEEFMNIFKITEEEYRSQIVECAKDNSRMVTIERDTGYDDIAFR
jgi:hypothetical protein